MKSIVFTLFVLVASIVANPHTGYPRPESASSYLYSRSSEEESAYRNNIGRIPSELVDRVPDAANILPMSLEALEGRDAEQTVHSLQEICKVAIATDSIKPTFAPSRGQINVRLLTKEGDTSIPLTHPQQLVDISSFSENSDTVVVISGTKLNTVDERSPLAKLKWAYECRGGVNFIHIDLGHHLNTVFTWMSLDYEQVGQWVGEFINELAKIVPVRSIRLIGHGVGAHVAGAAARKYTEMTGHLLPRITALDPAGLCYRRPQTLSGLHRGDAEFIDVIHTSAYGLGTVESIGDVDFYPNGPQLLQPGVTNLIAAHNIAMEYYAETVVPGNEENFIANKCNSMKNIRTPGCQLKQIPMGINTPHDAKGNFFLPTKRSPPYGPNAVPGTQRHNCRRS